MLIEHTDLEEQMEVTRCSQVGARTEQPPPHFYLNPCHFFSKNVDVDIPWCQLIAVVENSFVHK